MTTETGPPARAAWRLEGPNGSMAPRAAIEVLVDLNDKVASGKVGEYQPVPLERQVAILFIATKGLLDDVPTARVKDFELQFNRFLETEQQAVMSKIAESKTLDDASAAALEAAANEFRKTFLS